MPPLPAGAVGTVPDKDDDEDKFIPEKIVSTTATDVTPPPESAPPLKGKASGGGVSKWVKFGIPALVLVAVGLGVGLGVGLSKKNNGGGGSTSSLEAGEDGPNRDGGGVDAIAEAGETTTTKSPAETEPATETSPKPKNDGTETETTKAPTETEKEPNPTDATSPPDVDGGGDTTGTEPKTTDSEPGDIGVAGAGDLTNPTIFTSSDTDGVPDIINPLAWSLNSISSGIIDGYADCSELKSDITNAVNFHAERIIERNAQYDHYGFPRPVAADESVAAPEADAASDVSAEKGSVNDGGDGGDDGGGEDSFGTNNQVDGVDEADVVKSDGTFVFAAYADVIKVWDAASGKMVSVTKMPQPEFDDSNNNCKGGPWDEPELIEEPVVEEPELVEVTVEAEGNGDAEDETVGGDSSAASTPEKKSIAIGYPCGYYRRPRATVSALLLHGNRLTAFVSGYEPWFYHYSTPIEERPILSGWGTTVIRVYDTRELVFPEDDGGDEDGQGEDELPEMKLISEKELPGQYRDARAIGSQVHAVTVSNANTYDHLERHLSRWELMYAGMNRTQYIEAATEYAATKVVPEFVGRFMSELTDRHGSDSQCQDFVQLAVFQTGNLDILQRGWWSYSGVIGGLAEVTSFDVLADLIVDEDGGALLDVKTATAFVSNTWSTNLYANSDKLFLATTGYDEHETLGYVESTFVLAFKLPGDDNVDGEVSVSAQGDAGTGLAKSAKALGIGKVAGTVLNQYSMDFYDGHLRIATTTPAKWGCKDKDGNVSDMWEPGCTWSRIRDPYNQVTVLSVPDANDVGAEEEEEEEKGVLTAIGQTPQPLGKPGEVITTVRFIRDMGYVVTFERVDPFITLDLSDPTNPLIMGELNVTGWSNYLHPVDDSTLLAVGQEADPETGWQTGLQISMFGISDKSNPKLLARSLAEENEEEQWSSSEVQWDAKAFRYLKETKMVLLPATVHGKWTYDEDGTKKYEFFDGFYFFDVDTTPGQESIKERFRVNLADTDYGRCFYNGYMPARSLVFSGNATLIKGHGAQSHRLVTQEHRWTLDFDANLPKGQCWGYWG